MKEKYLPENMSTQVANLDSYMQNHPASRVTALYQRSRVQDTREGADHYRNERINAITEQATHVNGLIHEALGLTLDDPDARERIGEIREEIAGLHTRPLTERTL